MIHKSLLVVSLSIVLTFFSIDAFAQGGWHGGGGNHGGGNGYNNGSGNGYTYFDPTTVYTFSGTIESQNGFCQQNGSGNSTGGGMSYVFTTNSGTRYYLMTGPFWYLEQNGIELEDNLPITATGSVVAPHNSYYQNYDYLIVTELTVNGSTVQLRNDEGYPVWSGNPDGNYYYCPNFDDEDFDSWNGTVLSYRTRTNGQNYEIGSELIIRDKHKNQYRVYLSPQYYCEEIGFSVRIGDKIKVFGFETKDGEIVCQRVRLDDDIFEMRKLNGEVRWAH